MKTRTSIALVLAGAAVSTMPAGFLPAVRAVQTAPATRPAAFVAQARTASGSLSLQGAFEPAELTEVMIELDAYDQPLEVTQTAGHGAAVEQGDVLLAVETEGLEQALDAARNRKALADVNLNKAEVEARIAEESDALAARVAQRALANAEEAVSWFETVDGEAMLRNAEMMVERAQDSIADQEDELDQLRKMYKSEELTEDTADIVVKRALRQLRQSKEQLELTKKRADKIREKDYLDARQNLIDALDRARLESQQLDNEQAARKVQRQAEMLAARTAAEEAAEALAELEADAEKLTVTAPADGVFYFGRLDGGAWQGVDAEAVETGDEIKPGQAVATFYQPGRMQITVDVPEADRFKISEGATVTVSPKVLKDVELSGTVVKVGSLPVQKGPNKVFEATIELPEVDGRIAPGFSAEVEIETPGEEVAVVPAEYVKDGKLRVERAGEVVTVEVETGQVEDGMVQITEGITPGEAVLPAEETEDVDVVDASEDAAPESADDMAK